MAEAATHSHPHLRYVPPRCAEYHGVGSLAAARAPRRLLREVQRHDEALARQQREVVVAVQRIRHPRRGAAPGLGAAGAALGARELQADGERRGGGAGVGEGDGGGDTAGAARLAQSGGGGPCSRRPGVGSGGGGGEGECLGDAGQAGPQLPEVTAIPVEPIHIPGGLGAVPIDEAQRHKGHAAPHRPPRHRHLRAARDTLRRHRPSRGPAPAVQAAGWAAWRAPRALRGALACRRTCGAELQRVDAPLHGCLCQRGQRGIDQLDAPRVQVELSVAGLARGADAKVAAGDVAPPVVQLPAQPRPRVVALPDLPGAPKRPGELVTSRATPSHALRARSRTAKTQTMKRRPSKDTLKAMDHNKRRHSWNRISTPL
mmetsp:Transcript_38808/g.97507  ORF Transcript_38808/g.97507 Transcript_38808/m.97507 type:complete len:373 (+) Transcript_38808:156-1274(+)